MKVVVGAEVDTHRKAECSECEFSQPESNLTEMTARMHVIATGHPVVITHEVRQLIGPAVTSRAS